MKHTKLSYFLVMTVFVSCCAASAVAACSAGAEGQIEFNKTSGLYQYCNGTSYVDMNTGGLTGDSCSDLGLSVGEMQYSAADNSMVWCDGTNIVAVVSGSGSRDCSASDPLEAGVQGSLDFNAETNTLFICDDGTWTQVGSDG